MVKKIERKELRTKKGNMCGKGAGGEKRKENKY